MTIPKIWFLRHGQTEWNAQGRIQGQLESDLTRLGREQARQQARLMASVLEASPPCFVSPMRRARQTAKIALSGRPFAVDTRLAEVQAGLIQGMTRPEVETRWPGLSTNNPTGLDLFCEAPEGEGFAAFEARIQSFLAELREPTVIVAHGLLGQVLRGLVCGLDRAAMAALPNEQGCIYVLEDGRETVLKETVTV
ncbi:MAG: histidine phosphatase family protein [Rhodobacteraceae bacterium]|nr:histidine phosphatase family protein [Paracoccaceae bacterium]